MSKYFKTLWFALINKQIPSGLNPHTWYRVTDTLHQQHSMIITDKNGHIIPFVSYPEYFKVEK